MLNDLIFPLLKLVSPLHDVNTDTNTNDTSSLVYHLRHLIFQTVKADYAAFVANTQTPCNSICYHYYQYFSKFLNRTYYHSNSNNYNSNSVKTIFLIEDYQDVSKRLSNDIIDGSIHFQKNKILAGIFHA